MREQAETNKKLGNIEVIVYSGMPSKFPLTITWEEDSGKKYQKNKLLQYNVYLIRNGLNYYINGS